MGPADAVTHPVPGPIIVLAMPIAHLDWIVPNVGSGPAAATITAVRFDDDMVAAAVSRTLTPLFVGAPHVKFTRYPFS